MSNLSFFPEDDSSLGELPFFEQYAKENPIEIGEQAEVLEIWVTKKGGLLLKTEDFMYHYPQKSRITPLLLDALTEYCNNKGQGYFLLYEVVSAKPPKIRLAADFSVPVVWINDSGKYYKEEDSEVLDTLKTGNPFLPTAPTSTKPPKGTRARK